MGEVGVQQIPGDGQVMCCLAVVYVFPVMQNRQFGAISPQIAKQV